MYEALVKRLRNCATQPAPCNTCDLAEDGSCSDTQMKQAADAIEKLQKALTAVNDAHNEGYDVGYWAGRRDYEPKWIPVTERLPEDDTGVLANVYWPEYGDTMVCYGHWHKGWCHLYHHVEGELISGYVVTHWIPLPQPPKEET